MTTTTPESRGHLAYMAYCRRVNFVSHDGKRLPPFVDLDEVQREGWIASAQIIWDVATTGKTKI